MVGFHQSEGEGVGTCVEKVEDVEDGFGGLCGRRRSEGLV